MRPIADLQTVFELKAAGFTDREVSARTGVPVNTIRTWRNRQLPLCARPAILSDHGQRSDLPPDVETLPAGAYAYLLGMYLGDGCISRNSSSWTLRVALDAAYPGIVAECEQSIQHVAHGRAVYTRPAHGGTRCVIVSCTWRPWAVLFPQHGPGRKHHRRIELVDWQRKIVHSAPELFLRALIHTDGWRGANRVHVKGKDYEYPRYQFSNRSADIRKLFTDVCDRLGVDWRPWTRYHISVARRPSVDYLDTFIGPKC